MPSIFVVPKLIPLFDQNKVPSEACMYGTDDHSDFGLGIKYYSVKWRNHAALTELAERPTCCLARWTLAVFLGTGCKLLLVVVDLSLHLYKALLGFL